MAPYIKYCTSPNEYDNYATYFQNELEHMKELEKRMKASGNSDLYQDLFPQYYFCDRTKEGCPYICMENVQGRTLEEKLSEKTQNNSPKQLLHNHQIHHLYEQLNTAFYWLHQVGMLYLDLSPQNIMILNEQYDIKLIDFTHCYYLDADIPYHSIDRRLNPNLPLCIQLRNANALLFTRLFYAGNTHYADHFSYSNVETRNLFFPKYRSLLTCLFSPETESASLEDANSLVSWENWYVSLCKLFK